MTLERWERATEWPLIGAALVFLACYSIEVIGAIGPPQSGVLEAIEALTWVLFLIDYLVKLILAPRKPRWFIRHLPELAVVVLPALRPLRLLRLVTLLKYVYGTAGGALRGRLITFVAIAAVFLTYCASLAVLDAEQRQPDSNINTFGDALWWSLTTISTVGYGDHYPVTFMGRVVAAGLMVAGVTVLGVVTATLGSWLVEQVSQSTTAAVEKEDRDLQLRINELQASVDRLTGLLEERQTLPDK